MTSIKMSWHTDRGQLCSEWVKSEATVPYKPEWMLSSYPCEASSRRSGPNPSSALSPFGKTAPFMHYQLRY
jgi:hypothetical protein